MDQLYLYWIYTARFEPIILEPTDEEGNSDEECNSVNVNWWLRSLTKGEELEEVKGEVQHGVILVRITGELSQDDEDEAEEVDIEGDGFKVNPTLEISRRVDASPEKNGLETPSKMEVQ